MGRTGHLPSGRVYYPGYKAQQSPPLSFPEWGPWWDGNKGGWWCTLPPRVSTLGTWAEASSRHNPNTELPSVPATVVSSEECECSRDATSQIISKVKTQVKNIRLLTTMKLSFILSRNGTYTFLASCILPISSLQFYLMALKYLKLLQNC